MMTMNETPSQAPLPVRVLRYAARALGALSIAILLFFFVAQTDLARFAQVSLLEWILLLCFPVGVVAGLSLAWRSEGQGAVLTLGSLLAFYIVHFIGRGHFPSGPYFALLASPALLFGLYWWLCRRRASSVNE
jgi:hypothetical protein